MRALGTFQGPDHFTNAVLSLADASPGLARCLRSHHRGVRKEACWVLSNVAAGSPAHVDAVVKGQFVPVLKEMLLTEAFDIKR